MNKLGFKGLLFVAIFISIGSTFIGYYFGSGNGFSEGIESYGVYITDNFNCYQKPNFSKVYEGSSNFSGNLTLGTLSDYLLSPSIQFHKKNETSIVIASKNESSNELVSPYIAYLNRRNCKPVHCPQKSKDYMTLAMCYECNDALSELNETNQNDN